MNTCASQPKIHTTPSTNSANNTCTYPLNTDISSDVVTAHACWQSTPGVCPKCQVPYDDTMGFQMIRYKRKKTAVCMKCFIDDMKMKEARRAVRNTKIKVIEKNIPVRRR